MSTLVVCSVFECGQPTARLCHHCETPLCWGHIAPEFMTPHCPSCVRRYHPEVSAQAQASLDLPGAPLPAARTTSRNSCSVGDAYAMPGGRDLLVVDVWHAQPPSPSGRATCLIGTWQVAPGDPATQGSFVADVPYQFALFGITTGQRFMFDRVGEIDPEVARRYHHKDAAETP